MNPDFVLTFSDLQADIAAALIREGVTVIAYNQRSIAGILAMIRHLGATLGQREKSEALACQYETRLAQISAQVKGRRRHTVYFEEWDDPLITGIGWVSELIEIAGGRDVFSDRARRAAACDRIVCSEEVIAAAPEVILAS